MCLLSSNRCKKCARCVKLNEYAQGESTHLKQHMDTDFYLLLCFLCKVLVFLDLRADFQQSWKVLSHCFLGLPLPIFASFAFWSSNSMLHKIFSLLLISRPLVWYYQIYLSCWAAFWEISFVLLRFIYFIRKVELGRDREICYLLVHPKNGHNGQGWTKLKPGASPGSPTQVQVPKHLCHSLLLSQVC